MKDRIRWIIGLASLAGACSSGGSEPDAAPDLVASKVAILAIGVATGGQGHGFFDNFLTCPRRGVINYLNIPLGRVATFTGCDAGDGVIVDGTAEIRWVNGGDRERIARVDVVGSVRARGPDGNETTIDQLSVTGISFASPTEPAVLGLVVGPVRVTFAGSTATLDTRATPTNVFAPTGRSVDAIPNSSGTIDALTASDMTTIAYGFAMRLARLLLDETLESQRGEHTHQLDCGTVHVIPEPATQLVRLENSWTSCDLGGGIFISGAFVQRWTAFSQAGRLAMVLEGQPVLGGNVPRVALTRLEWVVTAASVPNTIVISGRVVAGTSERPFSFTVMTDD